MVLDVALLVAPPDPAEVVVEQVVALEGQERPGEHPLPAHHLGHCDGGVVVAGADGHPAEELEAGHVGSLEGLGALPRVGGEEVGVRIGQRDHPEGRLAANACDLDRRLAEVELGMPGRVAERDEHLLRVAPGLGHGLSDLGDSPGVAVLVTQALEDAPSAVALLCRRGLVGLQDLVDDAQELTQLGLLARPTHLVVGGLRMAEDLGQHLVADPVVPKDRAFGRPLHQDFPADLRPHVHVRMHLPPRLLFQLQGRSL